MATKKTAKRTARDEAPVKAPKAAPAGIGVKEVAEAAGVRPAYLRRYLRSTGVAGHEQKARYEFASLTSPDVRGILNGIKAWEAEQNAKANGKATKHQRQTEELKGLTEINTV